MKNEGMVERRESYSKRRWWYRVARRRLWHRRCRRRPEREGNRRDAQKRGDFQIGWEQSIGDHFSYDAAFDARFFGNTTGPILPGSGIPISVTTQHNPDFRVQLFANWAWSRALTTAIGYQGFFAGDDWFNNPITGGHTNIGKSYLQRLRGVVSIFLSPQIQTLLEVNGDVARSGGYKETVGTTLRFSYIF